MVAYSFQKQFRAPILAGTKRQTIRAERKRHARAGETLQLYTGMRTKYCALIGLSRCSAVSPIRIDLAANCVSTADDPDIHGWEKLDRFAKLDGFDGWLMMRAFWRVRHPGIDQFSGVLIRWHEFKPAEDANG